MVPTNATVTIGVYSQSTTDSRGNPVDTWTYGTPISAWLEQTEAQEVTRGRETLLSDWLLVFPDPSTAIGGRDRIQDDQGRTFEVVGPPEVVTTPRGPHHVEARLRHVDG